MKSPFARFEDEYVAIKAPDDSARGFKVKYVYYAPWYCWDLTPEQFTRQKLRLVLLTCTELFFFVVAGIIPSVGNTSALTAIPGIFAFACFVLEAVGVGQFCFSKRETTKSNFTSTNTKIKAFTVIRAFLVAVTGAASAYASAGAFDSLSILAVLFYSLSVFALILLFNCYSKIRHSVRDNNILLELTDDQILRGKVTKEAIEEELQAQENDE